MKINTLMLALIAATSLTQAQTTQESQEFSKLFYTGDYQQALAFYQQHHNQISIDPALIANAKKSLDALDKTASTLSYTAYVTKKTIAYLATIEKYVSGGIGISTSQISVTILYRIIDATKKLNNRRESIISNALQGKTINTTEQNKYSNYINTTKETRNFLSKFLVFSGFIVCLAYLTAIGATAVEHYTCKSIARHHKIDALKKLLTLIEQSIVA